MHDIYYEMLQLFSTFPPLPHYFNARYLSDQILNANIISNDLLCFSGFSTLLPCCLYFTFIFMIMLRV